MTDQNTGTAVVDDPRVLKSAMLRLAQQAREAETEVCAMKHDHEELVPVDDPAVIKAALRYVAQQASQAEGMLVTQHDFANQTRGAVVQSPSGEMFYCMGKTWTWLDMLQDGKDAVVSHGHKDMAKDGEPYRLVFDPRAHVA